MYWYDFLGLVLGYCLISMLYYAVIGKNPYSSELYIGKKGAGKSTNMARLASKYTNLGWSVLCTEKLSGTYFIDYNDIGKVSIPENSVLLIDEAGIVFNNRNWKTLGMHVIKFMKYARHYRVKLILFTQSNAEIDVSFMRICDRLILVRNVMNCIGVCRHLTYKQVLIPASATAEARITDDIVPVFILFGGITFFWMPKYWKYFDSFNQVLELEDKEFEFTPYPIGIKPYDYKKNKKKYRVKKRPVKKLANIISSKLSLLKTNNKRGKYL